MHSSLGVYCNHNVFWCMIGRIMSSPGRHHIEEGKKSQQGVLSLESIEIRCDSRHKIGRWKCTGIGHGPGAVDAGPGAGLTYAAGPEVRLGPLTASSLERPSASIAGAWRL